MSEEVNNSLSVDERIAQLKEKYARFYHELEELRKERDDAIDRLVSKINNEKIHSILDELESLNEK